MLNLLTLLNRHKNFGGVILQKNTPAVMGRGRRGVNPSRKKGLAWYTRAGPFGVLL
jgi:hypothetical protein